MGAFEYQDNSTSSVNANAGDDQTICKGESIILTASGGTSYQWSNGETTESIEVSPNSTRTYTVTVTEGGFSARAQVIVTVNRVTANAGEDVTINEGGSTILTASGGDSYLWNNGETSASIDVNPTKTTSYTVTVIKDGCQETDNVQVFIDQGIVSDPSPAVANAGQNVTICIGESVTLTANGGSSYIWSTGEIKKNIQVNPNRTTTYTLSATRGGVTNADKVTVTVENCNNNIVVDNTIKDFEMYPNPTTGMLNVKVSNIEKELFLTLMSLNGSVIYADKINLKQGSVSKQIDLSKFAKGIYFVRLHNSNQNTIKKLMVI